MPIPIPANSYPLLIELVNETYLDRIEQVTAAQVNDDGSIVASVVDGRKKLACEITDKDIRIKLMGGQKATQDIKFSSPKKKKTCSNGISCGMTCINAQKVCTKSLNPKQKEILASLRQIAKGGSPVAEKQITAIRVGQLNATRLANEKAKKAAMDDVERIIYESKQSMKASQDASRRLVDEANAHMKDLDEFISEYKDFMGGLPDAKRMQDASNALEQAMKENEQDKLDQAKKAIDKALSQHIDDLSIDDLDASDEMLKNSLKTMLGDERGTLEWQRITDETKGAYEEYKKSVGSDKPPKKSKQPKGDRKEVGISQGSALERVRKTNPELTDFNATERAKQVDKLEARLQSDNPGEADRAYRDALLSKIDPHSSEAALDRVNSLYRARNELEKKGRLSDDRLRDIPHDFGQGFRSQVANLAAAEYTAEIWGKLSDSHKNKFVEHWREYSGGNTISKQLGKRNGYDAVLKSKKVKAFIEEIDKRVADA
jgi:hypothetical protein